MKFPMCMRHKAGKMSDVIGEAIGFGKTNTYKSRTGEFAINNYVGRCKVKVEGC